MAVLSAPTENRDEVVVIVDPYKSGRFIVDELRQRGWQLVAVRSSLSIPDEYISTWNPVPFECVISHHGDVEATVSALRKQGKIRAVIAGSAPGVTLADFLAAELGLRGNDSALSYCRSDNFGMHERLRDRGLRACSQRRCTSVEEATAFAEDHGRWPLIVKPCAGFGEHFYRCKDVDSLVDATKHLLLSQSVASLKGGEDGPSSAAVHVQECLDGDEFLIDCVSFEGEHMVSAAWSYKKLHLDQGTMYDCKKTLPYNSADGSLYEYVFKCLSALGVRNGASHSKVVLDESGTPCLLESGAHIHGSVAAAVWKECAGPNLAQQFLVADVFTQEGSMISQQLEAVKAGKPSYELKKISVQVDLRCQEEGVLARSPVSSVGRWIDDLPTYFTKKFFVEEGDELAPTQTIGFVILVGADAEAVERDAAAIRAKECSGQMYILEQEHRDRTFSMSSKCSQLLSPRGSLTRTEYDGMVDKFLSPLVSRASSPVLAPQKAPALLDGSDSDELVEFMLDGDCVDSCDSEKPDE